MLMPLLGSKWMVQMDVLDLLLMILNGNRFPFVVIDCFTKWMEPLKSIKAKKTVGEIFVRQIIARLGILLEIHTNQEKNWDLNQRYFWN